MFQVRVDRIHRLVEARFTGFTAGEDAADAGRAIRDAIHGLGPPSNSHLTLYDVTDMGVAASAALDIVKRDWSDPRHASFRARRVAFTTPSPLARMQLSRLKEVRADVGIFADRSEAMRFLLG